MKHTYLATAATLLLALQAHGMEPEEQARAARAAHAAQADQDGGAIPAIRICRPRTAESIAESISVAINHHRQLLKHVLAQKINNILLPNETTPHEPDSDLHLAIFFQQKALAERLVRPSDDYSALGKVNAKGQTPLEYAREKMRLLFDPATMRTYIREHAQELSELEIQEDMAADICAQAKQENEEMVEFLEDMQRKYVIQCAKNLLGSTHTLEELRYPFFLMPKDPEEASMHMRDCGHALLALLGETHPATQPAAQTAPQPTDAQQAADSAQAGQVEEKKDDVLGQAHKAKQGQ
jgi:hypothetical protein